MSLLYVSFNVKNQIEKNSVVNPERESGRVTLITRYGAQKVEQHLPGHIAAVQKSGHPVAWICDPMHGKYVCLNNEISFCGISHKLSTVH